MTADLGTECAGNPAEIHFGISTGWVPWWITAHLYPDNAG
jgi:hypothetical protein